METNGTAYFVEHPSRINDLLVIHALDHEAPYEIVKDIYLSAIDYENFIADMTVDRDYIERYADLCTDGEIKKCLFIHSRNVHSGVLVVPEDRCWVKYAALIQDE